MGNIYFNVGKTEKTKYNIDFLSGNKCIITSMKTGKKSIPIQYDKNTTIHGFISVITWYELNNWL